MKVKDLKICHLNIRSLLTNTDGISRFDQFRGHICQDLKYDIIALSETFLNLNIDNEELLIENYVLFRSDRNSRGGGVAIYVREELCPSMLLNQNSEAIESVYIKIRLNSTTMIIGAVYRSPSQQAQLRATFIGSLDTQLLEITEFKKFPIFILGDFNDRCTNWYSDHSDSDLKLSLFELMNSHSLEQLVHQPTRGPNLLDLIFSNSKNLVKNVQVLDSFDNLDHKIISCILNLKIKKNQCFNRVVRNFTMENLQLLSTNLRNIPWQTLLLNDSSVDDTVHTFYDILLNEINIAIPSRTVTIRPRDKPGMTSLVRKLLRKASRLNVNFRKTGSSIVKAQHIVARREAKKEWKKAKFYYYSKGDGLNNDYSESKRTWDVIKNELCISKKPNTITSLSDDLGLYLKPLDIANCLNNHFTRSHKSSSLDDYTSLDTTPGILGSSLLNFGIDEDLILGTLLAIDADSATGPDNISNKILVHCAHSLSYPLSIIFRKSLEESTFPSFWKGANVTPIYKKKGNPNDANSYRPISLTCGFSKVFERLIYFQLYNYCVMNNILSECNSGFKKGDSAINQMVHVVNLIHEGFDKKLNTAVVYLDISSAFDSVWHEGLCAKLKRLGVSGLALKWLRDFLTNRFQCVVYKGVESNSCSVTQGVPQGSILGPLLFLIFINDMTDNLLSLPFLFADDSSLLIQYVDHIEAANILNNDLVTLKKWADKWHFKFNTNKTIFINYANDSKAGCPSLFFDNTPIYPCFEHKHLGITFTSNLKWTRHIQIICSNALKKLGLLRRHAHFLTRSQKQLVYFNIIRPTLEYGSVLYNNCSLADANKLDQIQRRAALICLNAPIRTESNRLFTELGWDNLGTRRKIASLSLMYKIVNKYVPAYLSNDITPRQASSILTRLGNHNSYLVAQPVTRLAHCTGSFFPSTIKIWNNLPGNIVSSSNVFSFKKNIQRHFQMPSAITTKTFYFDHSRTFDHLINIKTGLSVLNAQRFMYNLTDNPFCPRCLDQVETVEHFFLNCGYTLTARKVLLDSVYLLYSSLPQDVAKVYKLDKKSQLIGSFLSGIPISVFVSLHLHMQILRDFNASLLKSVLLFIFSTKRFSGYSKY